MDKYNGWMLEFYAIVQLESFLILIYLVLCDLKNIAFYFLIILNTFHDSANKNLCRNCL